MKYDRQNTILAYLIGITILFSLFGGGRYILQERDKNKTLDRIRNEYRRKYRKTLDCELLVHVDSVIKNSSYGTCWLRISKIDFISYNKDIFPNKESLLNYLDLVFYSTCNNRYLYSRPYSVMAKKKVFDIYINFKENKAIFIKDNKVFSRKGIPLYVNYYFFRSLGMVPRCK